MMNRAATQPVLPRFLPFLPADNGNLSPASEEAVGLINSELAALLKQDATSFWRVMRTDASLITCVDTYLRYKRRDHDESMGAVVGGESASSVDLARRVFMVLMRMVSSSEGQSAGLTPQQHAAVLYDQWLLDVPKLMDVCVLYGPANPVLLQRFMQQVFAIQPRYTQDLETLSPLLVQNLGEVLQSCRVVSGRIMSGELTLATGLTDACSYLRDVCVTLLALTECYSPSASALVRPSRGSLLEVLALLYDETIPIMAQAIKHASGRGKGKSSSMGLVSADGLDQLSLFCQRVLFRLLQAAYLERPATAGQGGAKGQAIPKASQEQSGSELMTLLMMLAHQAGGDSARSSSTESHLLQDINERYSLDAAILLAVKQEIISVDDTQFEYLLALLGTDISTVESHNRQASAAPHSKGGQSNSSGSAQTNQNNSSSSSGAASGSSSQSKEAAHTASLVASVKEILPDFGDGFVAACLHAMGNKVEAVVQALLEGSLPDSVSQLDSQLAVWPPASAAAKGATAGLKDGKARGGAASGGSRGHGKGVPEDDEDTSSSALSSLTWSGLSSAASSRAAQTAAAAAAGMSPYGPSVSHAGGSGFMAPGKRGVHKGMSRALGQMGAAEKQVTSRLANEFQMEYDDEYDDSFDDLQATGADGICDVEGDGVGSAKGFTAHKDAGSHGTIAPLTPLLPTSSAASQSQSASTSASRPQSSRAGSGSSQAQQTAPNQSRQQQPQRGQQQYSSESSPQQQQQSDGSQPPQQPQQRQQQQSRLAGSSTGGYQETSGSDISTMGYSSGAGTSSSSGKAPVSARSSASETTRPGSGQQQGQGGGGGRGRGASKPGKQWVLGDRIYNYAKEGAQEVGSKAEADSVMDAAKQAAQAIYGLGPGGNKGVAVAGPKPKEAKEGEEDGNEGEEEGGEGGGGGGRGGGRAGTASGRGKGRQGFGFKEANKSAIGNHHRKDRALRKMGL